MYFCICAATLLVCFPIYYKALDVSKENIISEQRQSLSTSVENFEKNLQQLLSIHTIFQSSMDYRKLRLYSSDDFPADKVIQMQNIQQQFASLVSSNPLMYGGFIYFSRNQLVISNTQIFENREQAFGKFLNYPELSISDLEQSFDEAPIGISFLPSSQINMSRILVGDFTLNNAVTAVACSANSSAYICGIISGESIENLFHLNLNPTAVFYIVSGGDTVIFSQNLDQLENEKLLFSSEGITDVTWNGQRYTAMVEEIPSIGSQAVLAIPDGYFQASIRPVRQMIVLYILCAAILGGIISIFFARYSYAPVKRIVRSTGIDLNSVDRKSNEYVYIENTLQYYNANNQALTAQVKATEKNLQINLFIRLLTGSVFTSNDMRFCKEKLDLVNGKYRVALFFWPKDDKIFSEKNTESPYILLLSAALQHNMEGQYLLSQMDRQNAVVLFVCGKEQEQRFVELMQTVRNNFLLLYGENLEVGLSSEQQGAENVRTAYEQARFAINLVPEADGVLHYYRESSVPEKKTVDFVTLQQLYELILAGETQAIIELFRHVEELVSDSAAPDAEQEAYAVLRYVVHNVMIDQRLPKQEVCLDPVSGCSVHSVFLQLQEVCLQICRILQQRRLSNNQDLKDRILSYIKQHFCENTLYADTIAREFNISEKYVYKLIREHTGQTLNEYIEQLRIRKAMEMLQETDLSVAAIASACGFNAVNTFYRIFKKYYAVSPSACRQKPFP